MYLFARTFLHCVKICASNQSNQIVSKDFKCFDVKKWCVASNVDSKSTILAQYSKKCKNSAVIHTTNLQLKRINIF